MWTKIERFPGMVRKTQIYQPIHEFSLQIFNFGIGITSIFSKKKKFFFF